MKRKHKLLRMATAGIFLLVIVLALGIFEGLQLTNLKPAESEVISVSALSRIINTSDLSTYRTTYNGVATAMDEKSPDKVAYYVSYRATVETGIDFSQTNITVDDANKTVVIRLPEVTITHTAVDPTTLDYIFVDKKAETETVSEQAIKLCEADILQETSTQDNLLEPARQNARNAVEALTWPLISQSRPDYTLTVQ